MLDFSKVIFIPHPLKAERYPQMGCKAAKQSLANNWVPKLELGNQDK
jgi:hypothetical protein